MRYANTAIMRICVVDSFITEDIPNISCTEFRGASVGFFDTRNGFRNFSKNIKDCFI